MASPDSFHEHYGHGIRENLHQFSHQLGQVFLVGLTIGMMRTVVPALAESEFGVAECSRGGYFPPQLAQLCHRHLPLLA